MKPTYSDWHKRKQYTLDDIAPLFFLALLMAALLFTGLNPTL